MASGLACLGSPLRPQPLHVQWFLTQECNYGCACCHVWRQPPRPELSTEAVLEGLDILNSMRVVELVLTGGNPLLRSDIGEILKRAKERFPLVTIYDNGSMAYKRLEALRHVDKVCISLDSLNPEMQNNIKRVPTAFENALRSINALRAGRIGVVVSVTISNLNLAEIPEMIRFFGEKDIPLTFSLYSDVAFENSPVKIGLRAPSFQFESKKAVLETLETIRDLKKLYPLHIDHGTLDSLERLFSEAQRDWACKALSSFFIVDETGAISGCHLEPSVCKIGELPTLWGSSRFEGLRGSYARCRKCSYLCYVSYSHLTNLRSLLNYVWEYEYHTLRSKLPF